MVVAAPALETVARAPPPTLRCIKFGSRGRRIKGLDEAGVYAAETAVAHIYVWHAQLDNARARSAAHRRTQLEVGYVTTGIWRKTLGGLLCACLLVPGIAIAVSVDDGPSSDEVISPAVVSEKFTGDLEAIRERGVLRALVSYSRTDFFLQGARPRGIMPELLREFEKQLNKDRKRRQLHIQVHYVIVPFSRLIPALLEGEGDIAVAFLTVTPDREKRVNFATGSEGWVKELLVTHSKVEGIATLEDLAGRTVHVLNGSSYAEHLRQFNKTLRADGRAPIDVQEADANLATEDLLELTNAGVIEMTVADHYRAEMWAKVLPDIVVRDDIRVNEKGQLGWAIRKNNPQLLAAANAFSVKVRKGTLIGNTLLKRYFGNTKWIKNPLADSEREKLIKVIDLFKKYGEQYGFDWLAVAAQAYQESGLDHSVKSGAGAVGIMQLLPSTAEDPNVGVPNIHELENNIHAGAKYMAFLRNRYFNDPAIEAADQLALTWAAYNAGPAKVKRMRKKTEELGLDPNKWFGNVELAALDIVGQETVRYVSNIYKYYITYKLIRQVRGVRNTRVDAPRKAN